MKNLICVLLLSLVSGCLSAQVLPLDETGKVSFYEVVKADSLKAGLLYANAKSWLLSRGYTLTEADSLNGRLLATNQFPVYDKGYVTKRVHGKISYRLLLEVKDAKYRFDFNDFVFAYYKEDRNFRSVPTGKTKALEETTASGWQKLWEKHRSDTGTRVEGLIAELKAAMLLLPKTSGEMAKQTKKADW